MNPTFNVSSNNAQQTWNYQQPMSNYDTQNSNCSPSFTVQVGHDAAAAVLGENYKLSNNNVNGNNQVNYSTQSQRDGNNGEYANNCIPVSYQTIRPQNVDYDSTTQPEPSNNMKSEQPELENLGQQEKECNQSNTNSEDQKLSATENENQSSQVK